MQNVASPSPKRPHEAAKASKDSAGKNTGGKNSETARKAPRRDQSPVARGGSEQKGESRKPQPSRKPPQTRRKKRKEGDWNYREEDQAYILEPQNRDVHKFTWIYLHYLCGHPKEYFTVDGFQTPGLKVVLPKAPVFRSLHYGEGVKTSKSRLWYDYYHDPDDPKEDPTEGADAEELEFDSDEEKERNKEMGIEEPEEEEKNEEVEEPGDKEEEEEEDEAPAKPTKFSEFIKTIADDAHPEINIPKEAQVTKSINRVVALIHKEAKALNGDYSRIYLGGWSQGAAVALCAAIHKECPSLGGLLATTGTFHRGRVADAVKEPVKTTPMVLYVGVKDDTYPVKLLDPMVESLRSVGYKIELREKNMDHNLNGNIGPASAVEERWMKQYIEAMYQNTSIGGLLKAHSIPSLDKKEDEAAVKVVYSILFKDKVPHNRRAEIMKHSVWDEKPSEIQKACDKKKLSDEDLSLAARFFGAQNCRREDLARFLVAPCSTFLVALKAGPAPMAQD